jgi:hypothetical protein
MPSTQIGVVSGQDALGALSASASGHVSTPNPLCVEGFPGMPANTKVATTQRPLIRGLGNIVPSMFTPVLAKHSKSFSLIDCISVGVDRMQRNFEPMRKQVEAWQRSELTDVTAKVVIYEAFVEGRLEAPNHKLFQKNS